MTEKYIGRDKITTYELEVGKPKKGGEGSVSPVLGRKNRVAKIYKTPTKEHEAKLLQMVGHRRIKWVALPEDVLYDSQGSFRGFTMQNIADSTDLDHVYAYPLPATAVTNQQKIKIARNICAVLGDIHEAEYVIGDFNPGNIGVNTKTGHVVFWDTDSYHVSNIHRCVVCKSGYAAPELLRDKGKTYAEKDFTQETDNFALAVHMFQLLMNGFHPFGGVKHAPGGSTFAPGQGDAGVRQGNYVFDPDWDIPEEAAIPLLETFPLEIAGLFTRAFIDGKKEPKKRPTAYEWYEALGRYDIELVQCRVDSRHQYHSQNGNDCPYCEADRRFSHDEYSEIDDEIAKGKKGQKTEDQTKSAVWCATFSPDGTEILTANADGTIRIWDAELKREQRQLKGHKNGVMSAVFSSDGKKIVTASRDETVRIWDAVSGRELKKLAEDIRFTTAAFSPDGKKIVAASHDDIVLICDVASGKELRQLKGHTDNVWSAHFSPDGKKIATASGHVNVSGSGDVRIWDAESGKELHKLKGHRGFYSVAFSPDGKKIATAGGDNVARIWDVASGKELKKLAGHTDGVWTVAWSRDGKKIVTTSWDNTAKIWDATTGKEVKPLEGHKNTVRHASFSPDGEKVVTASWDGTARIWTLG